MSIARFSLKDCHGVLHDYEVERFSVDENARFQLLLSAPLFKAISRAVAVLAPAIKGGKLGEAMEEGTIKAMAFALSDANWADAAHVLTPLPAMILAEGGPALVAEILNKTTRLVPIEAMKNQTAPTVTGDAPPATHMRLELGRPEHRNQAFGAGNMAEYWKAAAMVLIANFTPSGPDGSVDWRNAVSDLTGGVVTL